MGRGSMKILGAIRYYSFRLGKKYEQCQILEENSSKLFLI